MWNLKRVSVAASFAMLAVAATLSPVQASEDMVRMYRVVEVAGSQTLILRAGPTHRADAIVELAFDARALQATGVREEGWIQLTYRNDAREEFTGWAPADQVLPDESNGPTLYRVVDAGTYGIKVLAEAGWGKVRGTLPRRATEVEGLGACEAGFCPVRYQGKVGVIEGWAPASNLAVADDPATREARVIKNSHASYKSRKVTSDTALLNALEGAMDPSEQVRSKKHAHGNWWGVLNPRAFFKNTY
jgi:hypothetical protein